MTNTTTRQIDWIRAFPGCRGRLLQGSAFAREIYEKRVNTEEGMSMNDAIILAKESLRINGQSCIYERSSFNKENQEDHRLIYVLDGSPIWEPLAVRVDGEENEQRIHGRLVLGSKDLPQPSIEDLLKNEKDIQFRLIRKDFLQYLPQYRYDTGDDCLHKTYRLINHGKHFYDEDYLYDEISHPC